MLEFYRYYRMPILVTLLATVAFGIVAGLNDWSVAAVYGGAFALLLLFFALAYRDIARDRDG
jgi:predicted Co/Zn/Cd cation transporter (cation efflux family)